MKKLLGIGLIIIVIIAIAWFSNQSSKVNAPISTGQNLNESQDSILWTDWEWQNTALANGTKIEAPGNDKFKINLGEDNTFTGTADCNTIQGGYALSGGTINIDSIATTKMACATGSLEAEFSQGLSQADSFEIVDDELRITLADNSGIMVFARKYRPLQPAPNDPNTVKLDDSTFRLTSFNDVKLPASQSYSLTFKDGEITTRFCNAVSGPYTIKSDVMQAELISTDMACSEPANIMEIEYAFGSILQNGAKFSLNGSTLTLIGNDNQELVFIVVTQ
ncbi:MAG: META domain-containing protein [Patescibacteria group bacterium]